MAAARRTILGVMLGAILPGAILTAAFVLPVAAQTPSFFRIGTGGVNGTYYPVGAIVANAISSPPGSRPCEAGGSCGVADLIAIAVSSNGSVANLEDMAAGVLDSGFAQSDLVHAAYNATGAFSDRPPMTGLRVIASLYAERMQLAVAKASGIRALGDLRGRRVSLDEPGSGTLLLARDLLEAAGIGEGGIIAEYLKPGPAASLIERGELDAFFITAGVPTLAVTTLLAGGSAELVPLEGPAVDEMLARHPFLSRAPIAAGVYAEDQPALATFGVTAQWVTTAAAPEPLVYALCRALWNDATRTLLDGGHPTGRQIRLETALDGVNVPLHPGAERCYADLGRAIPPGRDG